VRLTEAGAQKYEQALRAAERLLAGDLPTPVAAPDYEPTRRIRQAQHRLTSDEISAIGEEYQAGMSTREIAEARKINRETVSLALRRAGIPTRKLEISAEQLAEAAELRTEGWSLNRLGKRFGVDPKTIKKRLARWAAEISH